MMEVLICQNIQFVIIIFEISNKMHLNMCKQAWYLLSVSWDDPLNIKKIFFIFKLLKH